tara:strand:- start:4728 stop:5303 length:576 start_codon:yes stop_codon:yes gene_type:complete
MIDTPLMKRLKTESQAVRWDNVKQITNVPSRVGNILENNHHLIGVMPYGAILNPFDYRSASGYHAEKAFSDGLIEHPEFMAHWARLGARAVEFSQPNRFTRGNIIKKSSEWVWEVAHGQTSDMVTALVQGIGAAQAIKEEPELSPFYARDEARIQAGRTDLCPDQVDENLRADKYHRQFLKELAPRLARYM